MKAELLKLPDSAQRLVNLIGHDAAIALIERYGGTRIYVPHKPNTVLTELLGQEAAATLAKTHGGNEKFKVPLCPDLKRLAALTLWDQGLSAPKIARRIGRHEETVRRWIAQAEAQRGRQRNRDLFETEEVL